MGEDKRGGRQEGEEREGEEGKTGSGLGEKKARPYTRRERGGEGKRGSGEGEYCSYLCFAVSRTAPPFEQWVK